MHWEWGNLVEIFLQCNITHRGSGVVDLERVNTYDQVSWDMAAESGFVISRSVYLASVRCFLMELRDTRKKYSYIYQSKIYALRLTTAINTNIKTVARFSCHAGDHQIHLIHAPITYPRDQKAYLWRRYWKCRKIFRGSTGLLHDVNWSSNNSNWIR